METVYDRMFMIMYNNKIAPLVRFHRLHTEACSSGNIIEQKNVLSGALNPDGCSLWRRANTEPKGRKRTK